MLQQHHLMHMHVSIRSSTVSRRKCALLCAEELLLPGAACQYVCESSTV